MTAVIGIVLPGPAVAQRVPVAEEQMSEQAASAPYQPSVSLSQRQPRGTVAGSAVGEAGRRQTRDQEIGGIQAIGRINNRINNRVQSRLRSRLDRNYDPRAQPM
ncbi:hypothetical protein OKW76_11965 [Sphingomonas sp. S1-29]|uniref:hypothetical protein n=1 Tax=Sphingomonas sp. S1-29 TaxID=2991074 RepID=UPI00223F49DD|nr:hypothetical protein [Sphingomonas sp. S1-29]UZK68752.1 hypothetical protein OKW76_11965 [Sphingomonas sp. S1-29]